MVFICSLAQDWESDSSCLLSIRKEASGEKWLLETLYRVRSCFGGGGA